MQTNADADRTPTTAFLNGVRRVAIFRALQLGDLLCAVPAFRALRHAMPTAHITYIGLPWATEFAARFADYIDEFVEFPGLPGLPERAVDLDAFPVFLQRMQRAKFDLAIQMHGSGGLVNSFIALFGAKHYAGYVLPGEYCPDPDRFIEYPQDRHEIRRHLRLCASLGAASDDEQLEFPLTPADEQRLFQIPEIECLRTREFVCIHVGARFATRRWTSDRFAQVANHLIRQGYQVVLTGSASERELTAAVSQSINAPHFNLAGRTSLGTFAALVRKARLVITNDTGMSHVAAATKTPSVVLVLSSDASRWAPLDQTLHPLVFSQVSCRPCEYRTCPIGFPCSTEISVERVIATINTLLHRPNQGRLKKEDICVACGS